MYNSLMYDMYLSGYLGLVSNYQYEYRGITVNYYSLNQTKSTMDNNLLMGGSYERVGALSSLKFNQISHLFVFSSEQIIPLLNAEDLGVLVDYSTTIAFPNIGLSPTMYDFLQFTINSNPVGPLFQVIGFSFSYIGNVVQLYKCNIKGVGIPIANLQQQVVEQLGYLDVDHTIHPYQEFTNVNSCLSVIYQNESQIQRDLISSAILI